MGYCPRGRKESDTPEQLHLHIHMYVLSQILFYHRLLRDTACSSPCCTAGHGCLSFIHSSVHLLCVHAQSLQACPTLSDPMNSSPPGSSVHGILQARMLEWVAIFSSRGSSRPRRQTHICRYLLHCRRILYLLSQLGSPHIC